MMRKLMLSAAALALVAGVVTASTQQAQAHDGFGPGLAVGTILGLGIAGAYGPRYYYGHGCYPGPRQCGYVHRSCWFNHWGERICDGGGYRCWRPRICD